MNEKIVLVTGANRGIGFETAKKFAEENCKVILTARNINLGKEAINKLGNKENISFCQLDISSDESVENIRSYIEENFGRVDILINNGAINYDTWQNVLNADLDEVMETINVNTIGAWRMSKAFIPLMKKNNYGRIINISSGAGALNALKGSTPAYSISKLALNGLTIQLANILKGSNINVNSICPGWVKTDMGGIDAPISAEEAADNIYWIANNDELNGKFVRNKEEIEF